jgi:hypothetical protein
MSSRARKYQRLLSQQFDSTSKHSRNEEFGQQREIGDDSGKENAQDFTAIGVGQFLELDPRPTFVLDLEADLDEAFEPVFMNSSLHSDQQLLKSLEFKLLTTSPNIEFNGWIKDFVRLGGVRTSTEFSFAGVVWTRFLVKQYVILIRPFHCSSSLETLSRESGSILHSTLP